VKCMAGDNCQNEVATDPEMPQMLFHKVCKFHWYVWKWENNRSVNTEFEDFTLEEIKNEADNQ